MTQAALIVLDDDRPTVTVTGLSWPEYRVRTAMRAGAVHIVMTADRVTPDIVRAIDTARAAGTSATLAKSPTDAADLFHPDEAVLLLSGAAIVSDAHLAMLLSAKRPTIMCLQPDAGDAWELIDGKARWSGLAGLSGAQIRTTAALVGEWAFASTLLRQAVAGGAERLWLDVEALTDARHAQASHATSRRLAASGTDAPDGWADRWIIDVTVRFLAGLLHDQLPVVARIAPWLAVVLMVIAPAVIWAISRPLGAVLLFGGITMAALAGAAGRATGIGHIFIGWLRRFRTVAAAVSLAALFRIPAVDHAPIVLALVLAVVTALAMRLRDGLVTRWTADVPGHTILIGVGAMFGNGGMLIGLTLAVVHAFASLAALQSTLSRDLTQIR